MGYTSGMTKEVIIKKTLQTGAMFTLEGAVVRLTSPAQKTITGTWLLFFQRAVGGKTESTYFTQEQLNLALIWDADLS